MFDNWIFLAVGAAAVALAACLAATPMARLLGILVPAGSAQDEKPEAAATALFGGFAVVIPVLAAMGVLFFQAREGFYIGAGLATFGFLILGYTDDRQSLSPAYRLLAALGLSALAIYYSPGLEIGFLRFSFLSKSLFLDQWAPVFTVLCIVGLQNAASAAGDRKILLPGMMLFWVILLFYHGTTNLYPLLSAIAAALAVMLVFGYKRGLSLGSSGVHALSALLGCVAVYAYNQGFLLVTADAVALMFLVPVLDFVRLALSGVLAGISPLETEQRNLLTLLSEAFDHDRAALTYFAFVAIPNILALLVPAWTALLLVMVVLLYAVGYTFLSRRARGRTLA